MVLKGTVIELWFTDYIKQQKPISQRAVSTSKFQRFLFGVEKNVEKR